MNHTTPTIGLNDRATVQLYDETGQAHSWVSQRQAAVLLRRGLADLIFAVPPGVRLRISSERYAAIAVDPRSEEGSGKEKSGLRGQFLQARRGVLYGNVCFENPDGTTMFHGDDEKALWYLNRGLVEVVRLSPPILRFTFTPGGVGHAGDAFYLSGKANRCVVCGNEQGLNRHHVVPSVYRRHLPDVVKNHAHHDVLLLCLACHEKYERAADELKTELGRECGVPLHGLRGERDRERARAVKFAWTLLHQGDRIPEPRREEMRKAIGEWLGTWPLSDEEVGNVAGGFIEDPELVEHGHQVVAANRDIQAFVTRWREHFLATMSPRFLPDHWDKNRSVWSEDPMSNER